METPTHPGVEDFDAGALTSNFAYSASSASSPAPALQDPPYNAPSETLKTLCVASANPQDATQTKNKTSPTSSVATPIKSKVDSTKNKATPTKSKTAPTKIKAEPTLSVATPTPSAVSPATTPSHGPILLRHSKPTRDILPDDAALAGGKWKLATTVEELELLMQDESVVSI